jgi:hypothetical protein
MLASSYPFVDAFLTLLFFGLVALFVFTIVHCIMRVRPVWRSVLIVLAMVLLPVSFPVYWVVYLLQSHAARKQPPWSPISSPPGLGPPMWAPDPSGRHQLRFWDGRSWTDSVADGGQVSNNPLKWPADRGH